VEFGLEQSTIPLRQSNNCGTSFHLETTACYALIRQDELNFDGCLILHCCSWWSKVWQVGRDAKELPVLKLPYSHTAPAIIFEVCSSSWPSPYRIRGSASSVRALAAGCCLLNTTVPVISRNPELQRELQYCLAKEALNWHLQWHFWLLAITVPTRHR
jgi:hypothetical protein